MTDGQQSVGTTGVGGTDEQTPALDFETWIKGQDAPVQSMLTGHLSGLRTALSTERESRKGLEKQVRDLALKAEKGSDAQGQLTQLADQIAESDSKAEFYDQAHQSGVTNLKLAYMVAKSEGLINAKTGLVDMKQLKERFPELFGVVSKTPAGNAGAGAGGNAAPGKSMNNFIRAASGRATR